mmetsp:Transcript_31765/g.36465  ORF Transcript_31765/g.36465 Transcript_31765/m.36465 type:complete len:722 (+) Transcript_31765:239-2404(+)
MGIYGKLKKSVASVKTTGSRRSVPQDSEAAPTTSSYAPPTNAIADAEPTSTISPDEVAVMAAASVAESVAASEKFFDTPNNNTVPNAASGIRRIIGTGSDNSKEKALLSEENQDHEMAVEDAFSMNNSTIATDTLGMSGDGDIYSLHSNYLKDEIVEKKSLKETITERLTILCASLIAFWYSLIAFWYSLSKIVQVSLLAGASLGAVGVVALIAAGGRAPAFPAHINVAFVGNSYFYANDLPRFVENIAGGHISQDSCLRNSASILQIIMTGNGMWTKWATKKGMINGVKFNTSAGSTKYLYDMGACSVPQLLTGQDQMISKENALRSFVDDGENPCFQEDAYREYQQSFDLKIRGGWDFVVITDQSKAMSVDESRQDALLAFNYTYGPLLKKKHISPIIVQPHAYTSEGANSTGLSDLATFTALIMEGAQIYKKYLGRRTGWFSSAHIAPVGNAFMAVYEESQHDLYPKLFTNDGIHPSAYGTYLYGLVIYATMTGYMPKYNRVVIDDMDVSDLFFTARRLQASSADAGFPTKDEAAILYKIAKKVALRGYKPQALRGFQIEEDAADFLNDNEDNNNDYDGNYYNGAQQYQNYNAYTYMYANQNAGGGYYNDYYQDQNYGGGYGNNYQNNNDYNNGNNYQNNGGNNNGNYNGGYGNDDAAQQYYYGGNYGNNYQGNYENNNNNANANGNYNGNYGDNDDAGQQQNGDDQYQQYYYNDDGN